MKKNMPVDKTEELLQSLQGIQAANLTPFFYTKLKGSMQQKLNDRQHFINPAWIIGTLVFFLSLNLWMITQNNRTQQTTEKKSSANVFAETFNLNSQSNY